MREIKAKNNKELTPEQKKEVSDRLQKNRKPKEKKVKSEDNMKR